MRTSAAIVLGLLVLSAPHARAEGVLAVANDGAANGLSANRPDTDGAKREAMETCEHGGRTCHVVLTFKHHCIAWARDVAEHGPTDHWGYATRDTMSEAGSAAVENCAKKHGGDCKTIQSTCDK